MAVVEIKGGRVAATYRDVADARAARRKYPHLRVAELVEADRPAGTLWDGNRFEAPAPAPPRVPGRVSKLGLMRALRFAGHWGQARAALARAGETEQEDWQAIYLIARNDPLVELIRGALDLGPDQIDALFIDAERRE